MSLSGKRDLILMVVNLLLTVFKYTLRIFPIAVSFLVFLSPCQLPFLGSQLLTTCSGWSFCMVLIRLLLAIFEFLVISQIIQSAIPYGLFLLLSGIILLWDEVEKAFSNSSGNHVVNKYRKLQVLEKLINACVRTRVFPVLTFACPSVQMLSGFAIIKLNSSMKLSHFFTLAVMYFAAALFGIIVLGGAGTIFTKSHRCLVAQNWLKTNKIQRRELKSLQPLRIWFGSNFVDNLTSLVIQHFCMIQTMNLLLLSYKQ